MLLQSLFLSLVLTPFSLSTPLTKRAFSNGPAITSAFPDPAFIQVDGTYYAFATTDGKSNIPTATSPDFNTWTLTGQDALPTIPNWSTGNTWAPSVSRLADGTFLMYFAATTSQDTSKHCVGTATSSTVEGPYTASNTIFACPLAQGGAIDPSGFTDSDGTLYVTYKIDGNSLGGGGTCGNGDGSHSTPLMLQPVGADGVTPSGPAVQILDRDTADGPLVEAPYIILVNGTYVLFFSSNCYSGPLYDTSYATASAVRGPYTKASTPLLQSGDDGGALYSPGGASVDPAGTRMVFHADEVQGDDAVRQMWTAGIVVEGTTVRIS